MKWGERKERKTYARSRQRHVDLFLRSAAVEQLRDLLGQSVDVVEQRLPAIGEDCGDT